MRINIKNLKTLTGKYLIDISLFLANNILLAGIFSFLVRNIVSLDRYETLKFLIIYFIFFSLLTLTYYYIESKILMLGLNRKTFRTFNLFLIFVSIVLFFHYFVGERRPLLLSGILIILIRLIILKLSLRASFFQHLKNLIQKKYLPFIIVLAIYSIMVLFLYIFHKQPGLNQLVWENSDSVAYKNLSNTLVLLSPAKSVFSLGLPLIMAPLNLVMQTFQYMNNIYYDNILNLPLLIFVGFIITPLAITLAIKSALIKSKEFITNKIYLIITSIVILTLLLYFTILPSHYEFLTIDDTQRMWLRVTGFVAAVEPLINLGSAIFLLCLAYLPKKRFSPLLIGLIGGLYLLVKEPNFVIWGLFLIFMLLKSKSIWWSFKAGLVSLAVYSLQLLYNFFLYGDPISAGRAAQDEKVGLKFIEHVKNTYGIEFESAPRISLEYLGHNLEMILQTYLIPIILLVVIIFFLLRSKFVDKFVLAFSIVNIGFFFIFYSMYIRLGATTRYFSVLLPFIIYIVVSASLLIINLIRKRRGLKVN